MSLLPGDSIERYVVDRPLGEGGMASVYLVHHLSLHTPHALKILKLVHPSIRDRLVREGWVQARLHHPNVVSVTDILDVQGSPGLLMEYVDGPTLDSWLLDSRADLATRESVFLDILAGVEAAHALGVIHRDLKPANILMDLSAPVPRPRITDFGLAKVLRDDAPDSVSTRSGLPMGTPQYMAPEQFKDARSVDQRTDIFSLGCILYELVTERRAFPGENFAEAFKLVMSGRYIPPGELVPGLPEHLVAAIAGSLEPRRERRIPDCGVLREVLAGRAVPPAPAPPSSRDDIARGDPTIYPHGDHPQLEPPAAGNSTVSLELGEPLSREPRGGQGTAAGTRSSARRALLAGLLVILPAALAGVALLGWTGWYALHHEPRPTPGAPLGPPSGSESPAFPTLSSVLEASSTGESQAPEEPSPTPRAASSRSERRLPPVPAPEVPEAPATEAPTPVPDLARVSFEGASSLVLSSGSSRYPPGEVPGGTWTLLADFGDGRGGVIAGKLDLAPGDEVHLRCDPDFLQCKP